MNSVLRASTASVLTVVFSFVSTVSGCKSAPAPHLKTRLLPRLKLHPRLHPPRP